MTTNQFIDLLQQFVTCERSEIDHFQTDTQDSIFYSLEEREDFFSALYDIAEVMYGEKHIVLTRANLNEIAQLAEKT